MHSCNECCYLNFAVLRMQAGQELEEASQDDTVVAAIEKREAPCDVRVTDRTHGVLCEIKGN